MLRFSLIFLSLFIIATQASATYVLTIARDIEPNPPYEYYQGDKLTGFHIDLISEVASSINIPIEFKSYPLNKAIEQIRLKNVDAITSVLKDDFLKKDMHISNDNVLSYIENKFITSVPERFVKTSNSISQLRPYHIGTVRNKNYGKRFKQANLTTYEVKNEAELFINLSNKVINIAIVDQVSFSKKFGGFPFYEKLKFFDVPLAKPKLYLGFAKRSNSLNLEQEFGEAMIAFKMTPKYQFLLEKYSLSDY